MDVQNKIIKQIQTFDSKIETVENTLRERFAFENCSCFTNTSERVTFTACVQPSLPFNTEIIKFNSIKVHVGIESLRSFISFGLFTCELPGLYLVEASVVSNAFGSLFSIRKNGSTVVQSSVSKDGKYESASLAAAVELNVGDTIDIYANNNVYSLALGSCVTIVKIS
ncbi:uncharacterized protein LOC143059099 [Mytilus galloprovincialis]|uniref:uncharacterized protein LOC143059099 n=1 Tax=Mytilus galloprovincialis TaxID=29158 RepID=UPI003F7B99D1